KLAEGLAALVLDVKCGNGAFMQTHEQAYALARSMVDTGRRVGLPTVAVVTDMNQPLGRAVGNAIEVDESVAALKGESCPADLQEVTVALGAELLTLTGQEASPTSARRRLTKLLTSGQAYEKFREMVTAQGGNLEAPRRVEPGLPVTSRK